MTKSLQIAARILAEARCSLKILIYTCKYQGCLFFFGKAKAAAKKYCRSVFDVANKSEFQGIDWLGGGWQPSGTDEGEGSVIHVGPSIDRVRVEEFEFDELQD